MLMKKEKNTKRHINMGKVFAIGTIIISICLMISLADLFSSLITVGGFSFVSDEVNISKYSLFAVCTSSHQTRAQAEENADICKSQGGAGYIYMTTENFYVVASIYETLSDAQKVKENLILTKPQCMVEEITIPQIKINNNLTQRERTTLIDSIAIFKNTYKKLYDISVSLDTSIITEVNARLMINELGSEANTQLKNFDTIFDKTPTSYLKTIKIHLRNLGEIIQNLIEYNSNYPYTCKIKSTYCEIIFDLLNLAESL